MRKRAQRKSIPVESIESKVDKTLSKKLFENKKFRMKKQWWTAGSLLAIFLMVLMLNTYFSVSSGAPFNEEGTGFSRHLVLGPDPHYNVRIVEETMYGENAGRYPFYAEEDPMLNYPLGRSGGRGPLMNVLVICIGQLLSPFMDEAEATGYAMQFISPLFGALLVLPIYFIGKTLFSRKVGLLAAMFTVLIPIHHGSGHGSAYALFDHPAINLFIIISTFLFIMKGVKTQDSKRSLMYAMLAGVSIAALTMVWVAARYIYTIIAVYAIVQMIIDLYLGKKDVSVPRTTSIALITGYLVSLPVIASRGFSPNLNLYLTLGVIAFGFLCYLFTTKKIPWTLSLPSIFGLGAGALVFLYFLPTLTQTLSFLSGLNPIRDIIFGAGVYGDKVSMTIAEAQTFEMSRTVMSFGPALFWIAWIGFLLLGYRYVVKDHRRDHFFLLLLFVTQIWFIGIAGRFMNWLVPFVAILGAWFIWLVIDKINYPSMVKGIKQVGGLQGLKKGVSFLHVFGILFIAFIVILPNAYLALDAAVPFPAKQDVFGDLPSGAFGSSFGKELYWHHANSWLSTQNTDIANPVDRPGFISWWDYGFYQVAFGKHPTVADNFQDGIPPASNFHISTSEYQAVSILMIRLLEGEAKRGPINTNIVNTLKTYLDEDDANDFVSWLEEPTRAPSYGTPIAPEFGEEFSQDWRVGERYPETAVYHDGVDLLTDRLSDDDIIMLYRDIQDLTGNSIRYYGVEGYDRQIFNIFGFLADRSLLMVAGMGEYSPEDEFTQIKYVTQSGQQLSLEEVLDRTDIENQQDPIVDTRTVYKDAYFETMFYRTYIGVVQTDQEGRKSTPQYQLPCNGMKHFYAEYISPYPEYAYAQGHSAVVIAKFYEGAFINGSILFMDNPKDFEVVVQRNITHYGTQIPVDHDRNNSVNGSYEVIVPAGEITLQVRRYPELEENAFVMTDVTFGETGMHPAITEEEATRAIETFRRHINIDIPTASLEGYVYDPLDEKENEFNLTVDTPLADATVIIYGIDALDPVQGTPTAYDWDHVKELTTDENGYYNASSLLPGYYQILVQTKEGFQIENILIPLVGGDNWHNVSKPRDGSVEGIVFFDENNNGIYDEGEELSDVTIDVIYSMTGQLVETITSDDQGRYSTSPLVPGLYELFASKLPDYETSIEVNIQANETITENIMMQYAPIQVSGKTIQDDTNQPVANMTITFTVDPTVENNTANDTQTQSDETGSYAVELIPGSYLVNVNEIVNETGIFVSYTFSDTLTISVGQPPISYNIPLIREEN